MKKFIIFFLMIFLCFDYSLLKADISIGSTYTESLLSYRENWFNDQDISDYVNVHEQIKIEYNCVSGQAALIVDNPQQGIQYYWFKDNITSLPIDSGLSCSVFIDGQYFLADQKNPSTSLDNALITLYAPLDIQLESTTNGATNPYNIGINGSSTISFTAKSTNYSFAELIYQWFINGQPIEGEVSHLYNFPSNASAGSYHITVQATHPQSACVVMSGVYQVNVGASIAVNIYGPQNACKNEIITLTAQVEGDDDIGHSYQWLRNGQYIVGANEQRFIFLTDSMPGNSLFSVVVTRDGCEVTYSPEIPFTVHETPVVELSGKDLCPGGTTILEAVSYSSNNTQPYKWIWDNGTTKDTTYVNKYVVDQVGRYVVEAIYSQSSCNAVSDTFEVKQAALLSNIIISPKDTIVCENVQMTLIASDTNRFGRATYKWFLNDELMNSYQDTLFTFTTVAVNSSTYTNYRVKVEAIYEDNHCGVAIGEALVKVHPTPTVAIAGNPILCNGTNVQLSANVNDTLNAILSYEWREANVSIPGALTDTISRNYAARLFPYLFSVVITTENGCRVESAPFSVYVNSEPILVVTSSADTVCPGETVTFQANIADTETPNLTYQWYEGDILPGNLISGAMGRTYEKVLTQNGFNYVYSVLVTQTTSGCTATGRDSATVQEFQYAYTLEADKDTICDGNQVQLTAVVMSGLKGNEIYRWYKNGTLFSEGPVGTLRDEPIAASGYTMYVYGLQIVQSGSNCNNTSIQYDTVYVYPLPSVLIIGNSFVCQDTGQNINLTAHVHPETLPVSYQWFEDNQPIVGETSQVLSISRAYRVNPYNFSVQLTGGCEVYSDFFPVTVQDSINVYISSNYDTVCQNGEVTLTAHLDNENLEGLVYRWYANNNPIQGATASTLSLTMDNVGTTQYRVQVDQPSSGCIATDTISVTAVPQLIVDSVVVDKSNLCSGGQVTVMAVVNANTGLTNQPYNYTWYRNGHLLDGVHGATFLDSPLAVDDDETVYVYSVIVSQGGSGCQSKEVSSRSLTVFRNPWVAIAGNTDLCETDTLYLTANVDTNSNVVGPLQYTWYETGRIVGDSMLFKAYYSPGAYLFRVEITRGDGCTTLSDPIQLKVHSAPKVYITASSDTICQGSSTVLTANLSNPSSEISYQWFESDTSIPVYGATGASVNITLTSVGTTQYIVQANHMLSGCIALDTISVTAVPGLIVDSVVVDKSNLCSGGQVTVTAVVNPNSGLANQSYNYTWYRNGHLLDGVHGAMFMDSPLAIDDDQTVYIYSVIVSQEDLSCLSAEMTSHPLTVFRNPWVTIAGDMNICETDTLYLTANVDTNSNVVGPLQYTWYESGRIVGDSMILKGYFSPRTSPYLFQVEVSRGDGCISLSETYPVMVHAMPIATITSPFDTVCAGATLPLTVHLNDNNLTNLSYQWFTDTILDGNKINGATYSQYNPAVITGANKFAVKVTHSVSGCIAIDSKTVYGIDIPVVDSISGVKNMDTLCAGQQVTLTAHISGGVSGGEVYTWYKNGIKIENADQPTLTDVILSAGDQIIKTTYNVTVAQSANGCTALVDASKAISVITYPNSNVYVSGNPIVCTEQTDNVNLTANFYPALSDSSLLYQWMEDNVPIADSIASSKTKNLQMTKAYRSYPYSYKVVVTNSYGCAIMSDNFLLYVNDQPEVVVSSNADTLCPGSEVTFTAHIGNPNAQDLIYRWSKDSTPIPGAFEQTYTTSIYATGTYVYEVMVLQTSSGCTATGRDSVVVADAVLASGISIQQDTVCAGTQVTISATNVPGALYKWYKNGILLSEGSASVIYDIPEAGNSTIPYVYGVEVTRPGISCNSIPAYDTVYVQPLPEIYLFVDGSPIYCEGGKVVVRAQTLPVNANYTYQWYRDNVLIPGADSDSLVVNDAARALPYRYHVQLATVQGCTVYSEAVEMTSVGQPVISIATDNPVVCVGGVSTLTAIVTGGVEDINGVGAYQYEWTEAGDPLTIISTEPQLTVSPSQTGSYIYVVRVFSPFGCDVTGYYDHLQVMDAPTVSVGVVNGYDSVVCSGGATMLVAEVIGGQGSVTYQWYKNGVMLPGETSQTLHTGPLTYGVTSGFIVRVIQSNEGCEAISAQYNVNTMPLPTVLVSGNTNVCEGGTVVLKAKVNGLPVNDTPVYQWYKIQNGYSSMIHGATDSVYTTSPLALNDSYDYYVQITSTSSGCSVNSGIVQSNVLPDPVVEIHGVNEICSGEDLVLNAFVRNGVPGAAYTYTWSILRNGTATTQVTTIPTLITNALSATTAINPYYITVSIERIDSTGCDAVSSPIAIFVRNAPRVVVSYDNNNICTGGDVTFTAHVTPSGNYDYEWFVNGVTTSFSNTLTISNLPVGNSNEIFVKVTPSNTDNSCIVYSDTIRPVVHPKPIVGLLAALPDSVLCVGNSVNMRVESIVHPLYNNIDDYSYQWAVNGFEITGANQSAFTQILTTPGDYYYKVRVSLDAGYGCASGWSQEKKITVLPQPLVTIASTSSGMLDICQGGEVQLMATITNYNPVYATPSYTWYVSGQPVGTFDTLSMVLDSIGRYDIFALANVSGSNCMAAVSNTITVNVNADPSWSAISVTTASPDGMICEGERVYLSASVQGGVQDAVGNTNGTIQWYVIPAGGTEQPVDGGLGGVSWDNPDSLGRYDYLVRYTGQIGSGCDLADGIPVMNPHGYTITVFPRPTVRFSVGDSTNLCANSAGDVSEIKLFFEGIPPFYFTMQETATNQTMVYGPVYQNPYVISVQPNITTTYVIMNLYDANCSASMNAGGEAVGSFTVGVSNVLIPDTITLNCDNVDPAHPHVQIPVNILSGLAATFSVIFLDTTHSSYNLIDEPITSSGLGSYIVFQLPPSPGDYQVLITLDSCDYYSVIRVPIIDNQLGGNPLVERRWDDVLVVNNNPANNGGHLFLTYQWYKNGKPISGANGQYYQELGGLNGEYSVSVNGRGPNGERVSFVICPLIIRPDNVLKVYPVPAAINQEIILEFDMSEEELVGALLDIFDAKGSQIQKLANLTPITKLNGFKSQGVYYGRITTKQGDVKSVKIVVVK